MMQQLRNPYWMKWGMWVVLGLTIPSFVAFYGFSDIGQSAGGPVDSGPLVTVDLKGKTVELGRQEVAEARFDAASYYAEIAISAFGGNRAQLPQIQGMIADAVGQNPKLIADFAVGQLALRDRLDSQDIRVTDAQVSEYLRNQGITRENLAQVRGNRSEYQFAADVRQSLMASSAERTVSAIARTSLLELWLEYLLQEEKITASYVRLPVTPDASLAPAEDLVAAKYAKLVADKSPIVVDPEKKIYEYVAIRAPFRATPAPSEEQIRAAYDSASDTDPALYGEAGIQVAQILVPYGPPSDDAAKAGAVAQIQGALAQLKGGVDFAQVANEVSLDLRNLQFEDPDTSPTLLGGRIPYLLKGTEVAAWGQEYIDYITRGTVGEPSGILETPQGYAIVKVLERRDAGKRSLEDVRSIIAGRLLSELREKADADRELLVQENLRKIREAAKSETTLAGIARVLQVDVQTTSPTLSTSAFLPGLGDFTREKQALDRLRLEQTSDVLQTSNGDVAVLRLKEIVAPTNQELSRIRTRIEQQVRMDIAAEAAKVSAEELKVAVESGDLLTSAAVRLQFTNFGRLEPFGRQSVPEEFRTSEDAETEMLRARAGDVIVLQGGTDSFISEYIVVAVESISEPTRLDFVRNVQRLERDLLSAKRQGYVEDFLRDAVVQLKPKYDEAFIGTDERSQRRPRRSEQTPQ